MPRFKGFSRVVSMLLAVALVGAPVLPSLAMALKASDNHVLHASHEGHHGNASDSAATKQTPCTQHDSCNGQCCAFCAQCFSAVSLMFLDQTHSHPVQISFLTALHPRLLATSPDRPPRLLSL